MKDLELGAKEVEERMDRALREFFERFDSELAKHIQKIKIDGKRHRVQYKYFIAEDDSARHSGFDFNPNNYFSEDEQEVVKDE